MGPKFSHLSFASRFPHPPLSPSPTSFPTKRLSPSALPPLVHLSCPPPSSTYQVVSNDTTFSFSSTASRPLTLLSRPLLSRFQRIDLLLHFRCSSFVSPTPHPPLSPSLWTQPRSWINQGRNGEIRLVFISRQTMQLTLQSTLSGLYAQLNKVCRSRNVSKRLSTYTYSVS
jgi:hypothetical protein